MTTTAPLRPAAARAAGAPAHRPTTGMVFTLASQASVMLGFLALWWLFSLTPYAHRADMPSPLAVAQRLAQLLGRPDYWAAFGTTVGSWSMALAVALIVGIPLGLAIGRSGRAFASSKWTIDFLRTIPSIAFVPLALLLLGRSQSMVVIVAVIPAVWPLVVQSIYAGQQADPILARVARSFRLTVGDRIRYVLAPGALSFIWPGIRLATTAALLVTVFAELLGGAKGIGNEILQAQLYNRTETLYAWVVTACALGLLINFVLGLLQRRLLWWHPSLRGRTSR